MKKEAREVMWEEGAQEIQNADIIDLTGDSEEEVHKSVADEDLDDPFDTNFNPTLPPSPHSPKALLTPIATVLKSDRLGIGLKAKTIGPHRASQKRVTHSAAALAMHIKAAEDMRKTKAATGRGRRGFAKMAKMEQDRRQRMLAYLND